MNNVPTKDLQRYLAILGIYDADRIDGEWGNRTATAVHRYCDWQRVYGSEDTIFQSIKASAAAVMPTVDWTTEPDDVRRKAAFVQETIRVCRLMGIGEPAQIAYVLATAEHETGDDAFMPNREACYIPDPVKAEHYRRNLRYYPYYGRGLIHWTWERNYRMAEGMLNMPFVSHPDIALIPQIALFLLVWTMRTGKATGVSLLQYVNDGKADLKKARMVVNGTDKQDRIAALAEAWLTKLEKLL